MKPRSRYLYLRALAAALIITTAAQASQAGCIFFCGNKTEVDGKPDQTLHINATESAEQSRATQQALVDLQSQMQSRMQEIANLVEAKDTEGTLAQAKALLDEVRVKTGIDPKAQIRESFLVPITFPTTAVSFYDLDDNQKNTVIRTIVAFRGGLYMDIMNLSKRVAVIYTKALKAQMDKQGGMDSEDRTKIIRGLVTATLVPMPVEDKSGRKIIVFDEDVANEDHTYMFNREIKKYLIEQTDLSINEKSYDEYKAKIKSAILAAQPRPRVVETVSGYSSANTCMNNAKSIPFPNPENDAEVNCFNKYFSSLKTFSECSSIASSIRFRNPENDAKVRCASRFN